MKNNLSNWSINHPLRVIIITLVVLVTSGFSITLLPVNLLPDIVYPEIRVRVLDPGVPASIMEDDVTRQLEEQLAITEDAIVMVSSSTEGRSAIDLAFNYGTDINEVMRDASSRLDRAKRFLPTDIDPPIIYKPDPSQRPVAEYIISSSNMDSVELREWADHQFRTLLLNLPGVASVEVGGGQVRQIQIEVDNQQLISAGLDIFDLKQKLSDSNREIASGQLQMSAHRISGSTDGRFKSIEDIRQLPLSLEQNTQQQLYQLNDLAKIIDGSSDEKLRIRFNGSAGIKISIQKQPSANTVAVVDAVSNKLTWLSQQQVIPNNITVVEVDNQARYIRQSIRNTAITAFSGALLAMLVVLVFLGSWKRTLIIGSAIPIAVMTTFIFMAAFDLSLNIMTLGGLALGIGMLVDNTIVMLDNIYRNQQSNSDRLASIKTGASEVTSAIFASTTTSLAAVAPFIFIGGILGLLFRDLIFTLSAAIISSMLVALTFVPALASKISYQSQANWIQRGIHSATHSTQQFFAAFLKAAIQIKWLIIPLFIAALVWTTPWFFDAKQSFLPAMDEGRVAVTLVADSSISIDEMDRFARQIETILAEDSDTESMFTTVGGFVFGRSQFEKPNRTSIQVILKPINERSRSTKQWIKDVNTKIASQNIVGITTRIQPRRLRGIRTSRGNNEISLKVRGPDLNVLTDISKQIATKLTELDSFKNIELSNESVSRKFEVNIKRDRANLYNLTAEDIGEAIQFAVGGQTVTEFLDNGRKVDVILRPSRGLIRSPDDLKNLIIFSNTSEKTPVPIEDVANITLTTSSEVIYRDRQQRIVEISAYPNSGLTVIEASKLAFNAVQSIDIPSGYEIYESGNLEQLQKGTATASILIALALFLVFSVMAFQYESLLNPFIIIVSVPFATSGVVWALQWTNLPLSMPVWLGLIMLAGIVVNNAIILIETIEQQKNKGFQQLEAIIQATKYRLRPILMNTITTSVGMLPLAMVWGEGGELLQPLAVTIVSGLVYSTLVSLVFIPMLYQLAHRKQNG